jgi:hypothetical protein
MESVASVEGRLTKKSNWTKMDSVTSVAERLTKKKMMKKLIKESQKN